MFAGALTPQLMSLNLNKDKNIYQMNNTVDIECEVEYTYLTIIRLRRSE